MRINKMPVTLVLLVFSLVWAILGFLQGAHFIFKAGNNKALIQGLGVLLLSLTVASLIRMFANIGQMIFDFNKNLLLYSQKLSMKIDELTSNIGSRIDNLSDNIEERIDNLENNVEVEIDNLRNSSKKNLEETEEKIDSLNSSLQKLSDEVKLLRNSADSISCDSKDINQNISNIKVFFEQIEKHLDLKK